MLQRKKIPHGREAFTMIEVMLAATVLLFAIVSAFQLVVAGARMLDFSRKQTIAAQIIRAEIDALQQETWTTVSGYPYAPTTTTVELNTLSSSSSFGYPELLTLKNVAVGFSVIRKVERVYLKDFTPALPQLPYSVYYTYNEPGSVHKSDMRKVTFTVTWTATTWTGGTSRTYSRQSTTYVSKNGLSATFQRS